MKSNIILLIMFFFTVLSMEAQKEYRHKGLYTTLGYEFGLLSSDLEKTDIPFDNTRIKNNINHTIAIGGLYKTPFHFEIKFGYLLSYGSLTIEGNADKKRFSVNHNYFTHTAFLGAGYNFSLKDDIDLTIGLGSSIAFVKNDDISQKQGDPDDNIVATVSSIRPGNAYIIPQISLTKYLKNGDILTFGLKYYRSANDKFLEGTIQNFIRGKAVRQVGFDTQNNQVSIFINYGFGWDKLF